jgi:hypothetical protein
MAEIFVNQIITDAGFSLIAAATSSNPVEYIGALSNATIPSDPTDRDSYTGRAGMVDAASATDNVARIVASFLNNDLDSPQPVKAIALLGKLSSYPDSNAVVVAYAADPNSEIVLPRASAPDQVTRFAFNLTFNPGSTISVFQTGDATVEDLLDLVSCHKPGQPTVGADQDIYGKKHFKTTAYFGGSQVNLAADVSGGQYYLALTGMKPELDGVQPRFVVGYSSTRDRNEITFQGTKTWSFYKEDFSPISSGCTIGYGTDNPPKINADIVTAESVGTNARHVPSIFATHVYASNLHGPLSGDVTSDIVKTNSIQTNDPSVTISLSANIVPTAGYALGELDHRFSEIHAEEVHAPVLHGNLAGNIPHPSVDLVPSVGSIFLACINTNINYNNNLKMGTLIEFASGGNTPSFVTSLRTADLGYDNSVDNRCVFSATDPQWATGKYVCLSGARGGTSSTSGHGYYLWCLLMRIE